MAPKLLSVRKTHFSLAWLTGDSPAAPEGTDAAPWPEPNARVLRGTCEPVGQQVSRRLSDRGLLGGARNQIVAIEWIMVAPADIANEVDLDEWANRIIAQHESAVGIDNVACAQLIYTPETVEIQIVVIPACEEETPPQRFTPSDFIDLGSFIAALKARLPILHESLQRAFRSCENADAARRIVTASTLNWHLPRLRLWLHDLPETQTDETLGRLRADGNFAVPSDIEVHNRRVLELVAGPGSLIPMRSPARPRPKGALKLVAREYFKRILGIQSGDERLDHTLESLSKAAYYKVRREYRNLCAALVANRPPTTPPRQPASGVIPSMARTHRGETVPPRPSGCIGISNLPLTAIHAPPRFAILEAPAAN